MLGAARTTKDHTALAKCNGALGISEPLFSCQLFQDRWEWIAYSELAEGEWHVLSIATDLDVDRSKLSECLGDMHLEVLLGLMLS